MSADYGANDEIFAEIGYGKIAPRKLLTRLVPQDELKEKPPETGMASVVRRVLGTRRGGGRRQDQSERHRRSDGGARAVLQPHSRREDRRLHHARQGRVGALGACSNVKNLLYDPERRIDVEWDTAADASRYIVRLTMQVEDRKGILADVSSRIAAINTNITNVEATGADNDHLGRINMAVEIKDVKHLEKVIKLLSGVEGVLDVERSAART